MATPPAIIDDNRPWRQHRLALFLIPKAHDFTVQQLMKRCLVTC